MASNNPSETGEHKRTGYLGWEDYFMGIAFLSAKRSKDPQTQVGACIVNEEKRIVGIGYNGMPNRCSDDEMPWGRKKMKLENKGLYVCHAELNAVLNKISADVKNCSMYVSLFPCNECAKIIIQAGIKDVFYYSDKYQEQTKYKASKRMFEMAGVSYSQYKPTKPIDIDFTTIEEMS